MKMKRYMAGLSALALAGSMALTACSDSYMDDLNTDPSKTSTMNPNAQLTLAQLQTYGDFDVNQVNRSFLCTFTQTFTGTWNAANYGGANNPDDSEMSRLWNDFYGVGIKNLVDGIANSQDLKSVNAALRIYRVYMMSLLTDVYGDVPCIEAGQGFIKGVSTPKYDKQEDIYNFFFTELDECAKQMTAGTDNISGDLIYNGDKAKWVKLANSLRMRFAMRISDVNPAKAKTEFEAAVKGNYIATPADNALVKYMDAEFNTGEAGFGDFRGNAFANILLGQDVTGPTYVCSTLYNRLKDNNDPRLGRLCRFYYEELRTNLTNDVRPDITDEVLAHEAKGDFTVKACNPGQPWWNTWPTEYASETAEALAKQYPAKGLKTRLAQETRPKLNMVFEESKNPGVVMTSAEVKLLLAEASSKGWNVPGTVASNYKAGVRESMEFLSATFGTEPISPADIEAYIDAHPVGTTADQQRGQINNEAWLLHITNPYEQWANMRRSDYPVLYSLRHYQATQEYKPVDGYKTPLRLKYPKLESTYNKANYEEAVQRLGGTDDWHKACWWDKYNKELDVE